MPAYTLGELMSQATHRVGNRWDLPASIVSFWANAAYFEVADKVQHAMHERLAVSSTTSGENRIDLPVDFGSPMVFSLNWSWSTLSNGQRSYQTLTPISAIEYDAMAEVPVGIPTRYVLFSDWMELHPSPDSGYSVQLRYRSMATDMVATSDIPSMSTPWRHAVLLKLEQHLHEHVGNLPAAMAAERRFISYAESTPTDAARRQSSQHPTGIHVIW
jgi:hypothetical protein